MTPLIATLIYICTCNANTQHEYSVLIPDYGCAPERDAPKLLRDAVKEMYEQDRYLTPKERRAETRKELKRCSCGWVER